MRVTIVIGWVLSWVLLAGCATEEQAPPAPDPCKSFFDIDQPQGNWMWARGSSSSPEPDVRYRVQFLRDGETLQARYVADTERYEMTGTRRENDWRFDSGPLGDRVPIMPAEEGAPKKLSVHAYLSIDKECHVEWTDGYTSLKDGAEAESTGIPKTLAPVGEQTVFSYHPCTARVVAGSGGASAKAAQAMIDSGELPVLLGEHNTFVAFTNAADDGDAACSYSFDYFWDGLIKDENLTTVSTVGEHRKWSHRGTTNFVGSHDITLELYRSCGGAERERIGAACGMFSIQ